MRMLVLFSVAAISAGNATLLLMIGANPFVISAAVASAMFCMLCSLSAAR